MRQNSCRRQLPAQNPYTGNDELGKIFRNFRNRVGPKYRLIIQDYRTAPLTTPDTHALLHGNVGFFSAIVICIK